MPDLNDKIVEALRLYLIEHRLKQKILSDATGLKEDVISSIMAKKRKLRADEFLSIVLYFNIPNELFIDLFEDTKKEVAPNLPQPPLLPKE